MMDLFKDSILNEEVWRKSQRYCSHLEALATHKQRSSKTRNSQNLEKTDKFKGLSMLRKWLNCYHYGKYFYRNCWKLKKEKTRRKKQAKKRKKERKVKVRWILPYDSDVLYHMTSHRVYFLSSIGGDYGHVWMENDAFVKALCMS